MAERSDVLVYDAFASGDIDGSGELVAALRRAHPSVPIVLTVPGVGYAWEPTDDAGVVELQGQPTGARLHEAIQRAIADLEAAATSHVAGGHAPPPPGSPSGSLLIVYATLSPMLGAVLVLSGLVALTYGSWRELRVRAVGARATGARGRPDADPHRSNATGAQPEPRPRGRPQVALLAGLDGRGDVRALPGDRRHVGARVTATAERVAAVM